MPLHDKHFGQKLEELEKAVGFRFSPQKFKNVSLAKLLNTTPETMCRKKNGTRRVTESDWSRLTEYFGLAHFGFETTMFAYDLNSFSKKMKDIGFKIQTSSTLDKARLDLFIIAGGIFGGNIKIERKNDLVRGGIGAEPIDGNLVQLQEGDMVSIKTTVPDEGFLYLFNEAYGKEITCLMPSKYSPYCDVNKGTVAIPTDPDFSSFPVAGPQGSFRLYAIWFTEKPDLALNNKRLLDDTPCIIEHSEFTQLVTKAKSLSENGGGVMAAITSYKVF